MIRGENLELNKIYNMDCIEGLKKLEDNSIDLLLTDIPHGEANRSSNGLRNLDKDKADIFNFDLAVFLNEVNRVCVGSFYIFCGFQQFSHIDSFFRKNDISRRCIVWEKTNPSPMNGDRIWLSGVELCVFGKKKGAAFNNFCVNSVLRFPSGRSKIHPTEKPLSLFEELIKASSNEGDLVLDTCMGSGTTAIAAHRTGRNYIGFELNKEYYDLATKRIEEETAQTSIFDFI